MNRDQALARQAELIAQVRNGTDSWTPEPGWADRFTDKQIWRACMAAGERGGSFDPMRVGLLLVDGVIDGRM
jgi:hypothetical protein